MVLMRTVFLLCLAASMSYEEVMSAPAGFFFGKIKKHFSTPKDLSSYRFVQGHTQTYIHAIAKLIKKRIVLRSRIRSVSRSRNGVTLHFDDDQPRTYDKVIFACNADEALALLQQPFRFWPSRRCRPIRRRGGQEPGRHLVRAKATTDRNVCNPLYLLHSAKMPTSLAWVGN
jgi:hypothetical protein